MAFKIDPAPTFAATVQISAPGGESLPLKVVFNHMKRTETRKFLTAGQSEPIMLATMVHSIDDLPEGTTQAAFLADLCEAYAAAGEDILRTWLSELTESRVKN